MHSEEEKSIYIVDKNIKLILLRSKLSAIHGIIRDRKNIPREA